MRHEIKGPVQKIEGATGMSPEAEKEKNSCLERDNDMKIESRPDSTICQEVPLAQYLQDFITTHEDLGFVISYFTRFHLQNF